MNKEAIVWIFWNVYKKLKISYLEWRWINGILLNIIIRIIESMNIIYKKKFYIKFIRKKLFLYFFLKIKDNFSRASIRISIFIQIQIKINISNYFLNTNLSPEWTCVRFEYPSAWIHEKTGITKNVTGERKKERKKERKRKKRKYGEILKRACICQGNLYGDQHTSPSFPFFYGKLK